jgi:SAM-dependent methyltransferase
MAVHHANEQEFDSAIYLLNLLVAQVPNDSRVLRSLGVCYANKGDFETAAPILLEGVKLHCTAETLRELVVTLNHLQQAAEIDTICAAREHCVADHADLLNLWGHARHFLGRSAEALPLFERAFHIDPTNRLYSYNISTALMALGREEESVSAFARTTQPWTGKESVHDVVHEYRSIAVSYEDKEIHQYFSKQLWSVYRNALPDHRLASVLELGCGTGLLAISLPPDISTLIGVDLSSEMLAAARARDRYDLLFQGDLIAVMDGLRAEKFDAIFSSCVLYHFADLEPVFRHVARLLNPGGVFAFSVDPSPDGQDVGLTHFGEYCHSREYLRRLAARVGLAEQVIHIARHRGPPGFWCVFQNTR